MKRFVHSPRPNTRKLSPRFGDYFRPSAPPEARTYSSHLIVDDLPQLDQRRLIVPEINLKPDTKYPKQQQCVFPASTIEEISPTFVAFIRKNSCKIPKFGDTFVQLPRICRFGVIGVLHTKRRTGVATKTVSVPIVEDSRQSGVLLRSASGEID